MFLVVYQYTLCIRVGVVVKIGGDGAGHVRGGGGDG